MSSRRMWTLIAAGALTSTAVVLVQTLLSEAGLSWLVGGVAALLVVNAMRYAYNAGVRDERGRETLSAFRRERDLLRAAQRVERAKREAAVAISRFNAADAPAVKLTAGHRLADAQREAVEAAREFDEAAKAFKADVGGVS